MEHTTGRCPFAAQRETRSGAHPLHLRRSILNREVLRPVLRQLGLETMPDDPHVTLAHSTAPVDWGLKVFEPDPHRIAITPQRPRFERTPAGGVDLVFGAPELETRWRELTGAGAVWDLPPFVPRVALGPCPADLPAICFFAGPVLFGPEWRATPDCLGAEAPHHPVSA
ncbi:hypothetical protein DSD19_02765 [Rhodovulum sp. BSW8]|uniref:Anti-CBASS protein Acb1 n=1 Tax=Rhodovulum visakhapatnamense TaxID=364297 RepID=A0A4R8FK63_9RHOB|nr:MULTISPECIES: hypothetical protein [Rhodovulum]OLS44261.1 hypothetical protein BV509_07855 [Rhodovulum sulfidophilum]MBL3569341.1 hypothetical protein [Rhodovulum visakhapatnamense]MBL3576697.1 hypothetical protein [Rhodovulum visakhapatnamense]RBO54332.1 hypothetical protein DSD19_02765 [Rhodovulum sp. BSW8]TDX22571.1 hypothetical protein EV657_1299 [Rhodovulum visakhapatnamense]